MITTIHFRPTRPGERFTDKDQFIAWYQRRAAGTMAETPIRAIQKLLYEPNPENPPQATRKDFYNDQNYFHVKHLVTHILEQLETARQLTQNGTLTHNHLILAEETLKQIKWNKVTIKATFEDGDFLVTSINTDINGAREYYLNKTFNLGVGEDRMVKCVKVELYDDTNDQLTDVVNSH